MYSHPPLVTRNERPNNALLKLSYIVLLPLLAIFTFIIRLDVDKYVALFVILLTAILFAANLRRIRLPTKTKASFFLYILGLINLIIVYIYQYYKFGKIVNVELFTLLSIYCLPWFYALSKTRFPYLKFIKTTSLIFFFLIVMSSIQLSGSGLGVSQQGLFSFIAFFCFAAFMLFRNGHRLAILSGILILAMQTRILILSMFVLFFFKFNKGGLLRILLATAAILTAIFAMYIIFPEARIFQAHTSGRIIHWQIIIDNFDMSNWLFGMGGGASAEFLENIGMHESMAAPHNEFIRYTYDLGLAGLASLLIYIYLLYKNTPPMSRALITGLVLQMFTDNILTYFANYLLLVILCILIHKDLETISTGSGNNESNSTNEYPRALP